MENDTDKAPGERRAEARAARLAECEKRLARLRDGAAMFDAGERVRVRQDHHIERFRGLHGEVVHCGFVCGLDYVTFLSDDGQRIELAAFDLFAEEL